MQEKHHSIFTLHESYVDKVPTKVHMVMWEKEFNEVIAATYDKMKKSQIGPIDSDVLANRSDSVVIYLKVVDCVRRCCSGRNETKMQMASSDSTKKLLASVRHIYVHTNYHRQLHEGAKQAYGERCKARRMKMKIVSRVTRRRAAMRTCKKD